MIEVLKQALEALEKSNRFVWHYAHSKATARIAEQCDEAITSLRKAIQEEALRNVQRLGQEIEQEPVATLEDLEQEIYENTREFVSRRVMDWMLKRYYTHPPQRTWVGLDHHDKKKFSSWLDHKSDDEVFTAIEAKLKELNT
jgi:hypothetical protein